MRSLLMKNKRGQVLNAVGSTVIGFMALIFIIFGTLFGIAVLNPGSFFTSGSAEQNAVGNLTTNLTSGVAEFSKQVPTIFKVLAVVLVLSGIALLILYVRRGAGTGGATGGL